MEGSGDCCCTVGHWAIGDFRIRAEQQTVQVSVGEAVSVPSENVSKIALADPSIADVVNLSDKELSIIGKKAGVTTLTIVKSDGSATQMYRVEVGNDAVALTIRQMIGNTNITVRAIGDALVLDGKVDDEIEAQRAAAIAGALQDPGRQSFGSLQAPPDQDPHPYRGSEHGSHQEHRLPMVWTARPGPVRHAVHRAAVRL